jgi:hypothetical protein
MFAFVDETGNTGPNLFDEKQPLFVTAALITRADFDVVHRSNVKRIAGNIGVGILHGQELGFGRIGEIAADILKILKKATPDSSYHESTSGISPRPRWSTLFSTPERTLQCLGTRIIFVRLGCY